MSNVGICITTINGWNNVFNELQAQAKDSSSTIYIAGDTKTPKNAFTGRTNVEYLGVDDEFVEYLRLPERSYSRKNIAYARAITANHDFILETDDDNIPYDNWVQNMLNHSKHVEVESVEEIFNPYKEFSSDIEPVWPRGLHLDYISVQTKLVGTDPVEISILQGLADRQPDVDAIWRLSNDREVNFKKEKLVFKVGSNGLLPTNSQNTLWAKDVFPLLYIPHTVEMRFCDILRGYIAVGSLRGTTLNYAYCQPTVYQERNPHNIYKDFLDEQSMYKLVPVVLDIIRAESGNSCIKTNLKNIYFRLNDVGIVSNDELVSLKAWLELFE